MVNYQNSNIGKEQLKGKSSAVALLDASFRFIDASDSWFALFGFTAEEVKHKSWFKIFTDLSKDWRIKLEHTLYGVEDIRILDKVTLKDGTVNHFIWCLNPWKESSGKHHGIVVTVINAH